MTELRTYDKPPRVARDLLYPDRITLPLAEGVKDRIDAQVQKGETRLDIIRSGIDREIKRREREAKKDA